MLTRTKPELLANAESRSFLSSAKGRRFSRGSMMSRIPVSAIVFLLISSFTHAQQSAPAASMEDTGPGAVSPEDQFAILEKANAELEERILALEKSNRDLELSVGQLKQTVRVANTAARKLSFNLARRVFRNASRHVSSMAGTSIPYVGAGVLVAMTAMDVKDGCESLRDLNEMNHMMKLEREDESHVCAMQVPTQDEVIGQVIINWRTAYGNAAAWANQYEARLPPEPSSVSQARVNELWTAVFGSIPRPASQTVPGLPISPTPPTPPTLPTITRP